MKLPELSYDNHIYEHLENTPKRELKKCISGEKEIGRGASGIVYSADITDDDGYSIKAVIKKQSRTKFAANEIAALRYIRNLMLQDELPGYYLFIYNNFIDGSRQILIIEHVDIVLDSFMIKYTMPIKWYLNVFWQISDAVEYLENISFNHGDLWVENVMLKWKSGDDVPERERNYEIRIIDFDAAYKKGTITNPNLGCANNYRTDFYVGYDLNRFFDSLAYSYSEYVRRKGNHLRRLNKIARGLRKKKKFSKAKALIENDEVLKEYDEINMLYPDEIVDYIFDLDYVEPEILKDNFSMSGKNIKKTIEEYAADNNIKLFY